MTAEDKRVLLHCIHNALWMTDHGPELAAIDPHIAVLDPAQKSRAVEMLAELVNP